MKLLFVLFVRHHERDRDREHSRRLAPIVWAVFQELETLFAPAKAAGSGESVATARYAITPKWVAPLPGAARLADPDPAEAARADNEFWERAEGKFYHTYRAEAINERVRTLVGTAKSDDGVVLVTDQELDPGPFADKARYIMFTNSGPYTQLVATPVLDPGYWDQYDPQRFATLKQRVRAACGRSAGQLLGLKQCTTRHCYLRSFVATPPALDPLVGICDKHDAPALTWKGFRPVEGEPADVQELITIPPSPGV